MSSPKVVFLISAPYSGATLLSILMNQHPEISSDGEIFPYIRGSEVICSCGKPQIECEYYRTVASSMIRTDKNEYDDRIFYYVPRYINNYYLSRSFEGFWINDLAHKVRNFISLIPRFKKLEDEFLTHHIELFSKSLKLRNASVYFDGSKSVRRAEFFAEKKLTSKMIYLIRDGRAFCSSFLKNKELSQSCLSMAAKVWQQSIKKVDVLIRRLPNVKILDVRYNDLCKSPERELKRIWAFLGLNYEEAFLEYHRNDMHILGNRMRNEYTGMIREDQSWKTQMSQEDILLLNSLLERELSRFNFDKVIQ